MQADKSVIDLSALLLLVEQTGEKVCEIYEQDPSTVEIQQKIDASPVTTADLIAHQMLVAGLQQLTPALPILSEESKALDIEQRKSWEKYWLIDPLDGTREFLARTDEFSINVALIENHKPILGVIYIPVAKSMYYATPSIGAFKKNKNVPAVAIQARKLDLSAPVIVASRRHTGNSLLAGFLNNLACYERISAGSALKFCLVAEGRADVYPRFGDTSEWDTAAGQCILEAAGGAVLDTNLQPLRYNARDNLINPHFIAVGDPKNVGVIFHAKTY